jgi:acyl-CoA thioester hydrolase
MPRTSTLTFAVQWGDMDALGHVNNTVYFRWFESARIQIFVDCGRSPPTSTRGVGPILATATCDYLKPVVYPCEVTVSVEVTKIGRTSIAMAYQLFRAGRPEEVFARGTSVVVMLDYDSGQKVEVPEELRRRMQE